MEEVENTTPTSPTTSPLPPACFAPEVGLDSLEILVHSSPQHHLHHETISEQPQPLSMDHPGLVGSQIHNTDVAPHNQKHPEWLSLIMNFSFAAISISFQLNQSPMMTSKPPPISLHFAGLGLVLALAFIVISKYIPAADIGRPVKQALENVGVFFGVTSFTFSITLSFPFYFKLISWLIYAIAFIIILSFRYLRLSSA